MAGESEKDADTQRENAHLGGQLSHKNECGQQGHQAEPIGSQESFGQSDEQGSGFMAQQGTGSDDVLQENIGQGDLAQQDALTQQNDDGMGEAAGEEDGS